MTAAYTELSIGIEREGNRLRVRIAGDLDHHSAPGLRPRLDDALTDDVRTIHLDLTGVTFIDSAALQVFVSVYDEMRGRGGTLAITDASPLVARILEVTGFGNLFDG